MISIGDRVVIAARSEFLAFVDGWRGKVVATAFANLRPDRLASPPSGMVWVEVRDEEVDKHFLVPLDQLHLTI